MDDKQQTIDDLLAGFGSTNEEAPTPSATVDDILGDFEPKEGLEVKAEQTHDDIDKVVSDETKARAQAALKTAGEGAARAKEFAQAATTAARQQLREVKVSRKAVLTGVGCLALLGLSFVIVTLAPKFRSDTKEPQTRSATRVTTTPPVATQPTPTDPISDQPIATEQPQPQVTEIIYERNESPSDFIDVPLPPSSSYGTPSQSGMKAKATRPKAEVYDDEDEVVWVDEEVEATKPKAPPKEDWRDKADRDLDRLLND